MFRFLLLLRRALALISIALLLFPNVASAEELISDSGTSPETQEPPNSETPEAMLEESAAEEQEANPEASDISETDPLLKVANVDFTQLMINEVDLEAEFIELWNMGTVPLDLTGLQFSEIAGSAEARHPFSEFTSETLLPSQGFLVLTMSRKLNNTGETIKLYADAGAASSFQTLIVPATQSGKSYARMEQGNFVWSTPTPGMPNFTVTPPELPEIPVEPPEEPTPVLPENGAYAALILNEVDLEAEFIELWNAGETALDLHAFEFSELAAGNEAHHALSGLVADTTLPAHGFFIIPLSRLLNNSGETIRLYIHPQVTTPLTTLEVPALQSGKSYARNSEGTFAWTTPTPGTENLFELPPVRSRGTVPRCFASYFFSGERSR